MDILIASGVPQILVALRRGVRSYAHDDGRGDSASQLAYD